MPTPTLADDPFAAYQQPAADPFTDYQQPREQQPSAPSGVVSYAQKLGSNIWNAAKGTGQLISDIGSMGTDPMAAQRVYDTVVQPQIEQGKKAVQAARGQGEFAGMGPVGRTSEAVGHGLAAALPGIGPAAAEAGEKFGSGDISGGAADATTLGLMMAAPELGSRVGRLTAGKLIGTDPDVTAWQALKPRGGAQEHYDTSAIARGDIKAAAVRRQYPINNARDLDAAIDGAMNDNRSIAEQHWDQFRRTGQQIPLDDIADGISNTVSPRTRFLAQGQGPAAVAAQNEVAAIDDFANQFRGRSVDVNTFRRMKEEVNADLHTFEMKTDDAKNAILGQRGGVNTLNAEANGYRQLTAQYAGRDLSDIDYRYGRLKDWKAATQKAMEKELSEASKSILQTGARVASIPGKIATGSAEDIPGSISGKTATDIKHIFDVTKPGAPLPIPGQMPLGTPRQIPGPSPQIPGSGSYVSGRGGMPPGQQQNVWQGIGAPKRLPAGSPTQGQGVIQVPPAGAANIQTPGGPPLTQIPPSPRTAAPPADTSGVFGSQRGSFSPKSTRPQPGTPEDIDFQQRYGEYEQPEVAAFLGHSGKPPAPVEPLAKRMGKQIWNALGGPEIGEE